MVKKSALEKMVLQKNKNKGNNNNNEDQKTRSNRFLVNINILGSAGPIRFVVNEKDLVSGVIDTALKSYAREGRLPVLGSDANNFFLYCANAGFDGVLIKDSTRIGAYFSKKQWWLEGMVKQIL
ncbi:uncharacterized protein LOC133312955 isoform X2 [Gastrolobium bilobum]|uniref:uncharacterized protein LOC133312955 isoform X2 n=1 Tax=Gastrolobium bilobum TaxID=150636 RepID=UPI002AB043EB|nr:uncharacterized protein LOC133312955 isoform X2 [Gastrolobium bilobum]